MGEPPTRRGRQRSRPLYARSDYSRTLPLLTRPERDWRGQFRRDYARLLHSPAFRRLQGKTQLFSGLESDFFRNRLTYSLEVAQIAKSIALKINDEHLRGEGFELDTDLVEFAGLAHDIGHPPFGHTGEHVLNDIMRRAGGFEGNAQSLRILTRLEKKLDDPDAQLNEVSDPLWFRNGRDHAVGLNLCSRTIASVLKYDRAIPAVLPSSRVIKGYYQTETDVVSRVRRDVAPGVSAMKTVECQIMDIADDIAYSTYDIEDAFKGILTTPLHLRLLAVWCGQ
jgi:dGTPase